MYGLMEWVHKSGKLTVTVADPNQNQLSAV